MGIDRRPDEDRTFERALALAQTGGYPDVQSIIRRLQWEGFETPLTDLRTRGVREHLRQACAAARATHVAARRSSAG